MDAKLAASAVATVAQIALAMLIFAWPLPRRPHFWARLGGLAAAGIALTLVGVAVAGATGISTTVGPARVLAVFVLFSMVLVLAVPVLLVLFDTSVWVALFFATAGYTLQNLASGAEGLLVFTLGERTIPLELAETAAVTCIVYFLGYLAFALPVRRHGLADVEDHAMLVVVAAVLLVVIAFDLVNKSLPALGASTGDVVLLRVIHGISCVFMLTVEFELLYTRSLRTNVAAMERARADDAKGLEASRSNVRAINVRMHDIRHQLRDLEALDFVGADALDDLERQLSVYDAAVKTGNVALDTVLTEKGLICEREGIALGCVADGDALSFMAPADIYSLFGDAVDNAIEAVEKLNDPDKRVIDLTVRDTGGMVSAHVENYFRGDVRLANGLPLAQTRQDARGFGARHMRAVVERYGGSITTSTEGDLFRLDVIVPLPAKGVARR
ncbi:MAG: ATP-binding protein [Olsenella sp.]|jgi:hypothetical protein|nr:ATP-binding protein [Olsenella sp.]